MHFFRGLTSERTVAMNRYGTSIQDWRSLILTQPILRNISPALPALCRYLLFSHPPCLSLSKFTITHPIIKNVVLGVKCRNRVRNVSFFCLFYHFLFVCLIQKHHKVKLIILIIDMYGSAVFLTCLADGTQAQAFFLSAPLR